MYFHPLCLRSRFTTRRWMSPFLKNCLWHLSRYQPPTFIWWSRFLSSLVFTFCYEFEENSIRSCPTNKILQQQVCQFLFFFTSPQEISSEYLWDYNFFFILNILFHLDFISAEQKKNHHGNSCCDEKVMYASVLCIQWISIYLIWFTEERIIQ